jgi:hypothetical protein
MVAYLHLQAVEVPHIKNLVTVVLDSQLHLLRSMKGPASHSSSLHSRRPRPLRHSCPCSRPSVATPRQHRHVLDLWDHLPGSPGHRADSSSTPSFASSSRVTCPGATTAGR